MHPGKIVYEGKTKDGEKLLIRYVQKGDEEMMANYINTLSKEESFVAFQGETMTVEEERKYLEEQLKKIDKKLTVHLLVFSNDILIGIAGLDMQTRGAMRHVGAFGISIAKEYRGEGIGKLLMQSVLEEGEKNIPQLRIVELGVFANNPIAMEMYKKFGFVQHGSLPQGVLRKGEYHDHHMMYKVIRRG